MLNVKRDVIARTSCSQHFAAAAACGFLVLGQEQRSVFSLIMQGQIRSVITSERNFRQTFTQVLISMSLLFVNKDSKWVTRVSPFEEVDGELSESYPNVNHCCFRYLGFEAELSRSQVVKFFLPKHFAKLKRILCCGVTSANSQPWQYHVSPKNAWNASLPSLRPAFALSRWISESRVSIKIILVIWFGALAQQVFGLIS